MRWPWNSTPERDNGNTMTEEKTQAITDPAREEIRRSQDRLSRIDRILREARAAEAVAKRAQPR